MGQKGNNKKKPSQNKSKIKGQNDANGAVSSLTRDAKNQPALIRETEKGTSNTNSETKKGSRK